MPLDFEYHFTRNCPMIFVVVAGIGIEFIRNNGSKKRISSDGHVNFLYSLGI